MVNLKALSIKHPAKDLIGLVLSTYSNNLREDTPLIDLAWLNSALLYSSVLKKNDKSLNLLKKQINSFDADDTSNFTVQQGVGLIIGINVLLTLKIYNNGKIVQLKKYFEKLSNADWLRVREVAALFCSTFKTQPGFEDLVTSAKAYLSKEFKKNHNPVGISLFGLSQTGNVDDLIDATVEADIQTFLSSKRKSLEELSYLCLALRESKSGSTQVAFEKFQNAIYEQLYEVTLENSEVISLLLVILYLSDSEPDGERILEKLKTSNIKEETKRRVSEIIKSDNNLLINFRDGKPANPLIFKSMSIALYALSQIPLSNAFLFHPALKEKVEVFLQTSQGKQFSAVSRWNLYLLLAVFDVVVLILGFKIWWPLFDSIFKSIDLMSSGIIKTIAQWFSWLGFLYPIYILLNFNIGILNKGWFKLGELAATLTPETFINKIRDLRRK